LKSLAGEKKFDADFNLLWADARPRAHTLLSARAMGTSNMG